MKDSKIKEFEERISAIERRLKRVKDKLEEECNLEGEDAP